MDAIDIKIDRVTIEVLNELGSCNEEFNTLTEAGAFIHGMALGMYEANPVGYYNLYGAAIHPMSYLAASGIYESNAMGAFLFGQAVGNEPGHLGHQ